MPVSKSRRKNKKAPPPATPKRKKEAGSEALPPLPDRRAMEGMMAQFTGGLFGDDDWGGEGDSMARAQDLMYDAWDTPTKRERIKLARQALTISDLCADAHVLLAEEAAKNLVEAKAHLEAGMAAGEKALGPEAFEEGAGHFWGLLETRPYMRARAGLAETLWELGERSAAIAHLQDMLRLNPNDNQGLRHILAGWLLAAKDHDALDTLIAAYDEDVFAEWAYTKTLLAFRRNGPSQKAEAALEAAWARNAHVPAYLTGERKIPRRMADHYSLGSKEEAFLYALVNTENWAATEGALTWLAKATKNLPPPKKRR